MGYSDNLNELLISHDELVIVCRTIFEIILDQGLQPLLDRKLEEAQITPGFAERSLEIQEKFCHERRKLMATGELK